MSGGEWSGGVSWRLLHWDATRRMWCCKWSGIVETNPGREHVCERVPVEVMPCEIKMSAASMALDCVE